MFEESYFLKKKYGFCVSTEYPIGKFFDEELWCCNFCFFTRCTSYKTCLACNETKCLILNEKNRCECKVVSFINPETYACQACPVNCLKCFSENQCSECKEGLVYDENNGVLPLRRRFLQKLSTLLSLFDRL